MESENSQGEVYSKAIINDLKDLEKQILKVRFLSQDAADTFYNKLMEIKEYVEKADLSSGGISEDLAKVINQITSLQFDITYWRENEGKEIQNVKIINDIGQDILEALEKGNIDVNYIITGLAEVRKKWESRNLSYVQIWNLNSNLSSALEKVIELKFRKGESFDLSDVDKISSKTDLVDSMKKAMVKKAENNSSNYDLEMLVDSLNEDNFTDAKYWQILTGKDFAEFIETKEKGNENNEDVSHSEKNKNPILNGLFAKNKDVALYYGDIDEETGKYEIKYTVYKDFSKKKLDTDKLPIKYRGCKLIGMDIDDERIQESSENNQTILVWNLQRFFRLYNLKFVNIGDSIKKIPDRFFESSRIETITLGKNVETIGRMAFWCSYCKKIIMGDNVKTIESWIPKNDPGHCVGAFERCENLTDIRLSNSLTVIPPRCFKSCIKLSKINIPDSVTVIGQGAFEDCENLDSVIIGKGAEIIEEGAFLNIKADEVNIPKNVKLIKILAFLKYSGYPPDTLRYMPSEYLKKYKEDSFRDAVVLNFEDEEHKPKIETKMRSKQEKQNESITEKANKIPQKDNNHLTTNIQGNQDGQEPFDDD